MLIIKNRKNNKSNMLVIILIASIIINSVLLCESSPINRVESIDYNLRRPIVMSRQVRPRDIRSPPSTPDAISSGDTSAPQMSVESSRQPQSTEAAGLNQDYYEDEGDYLSALKLTDLRDLNRTEAMVKITQPSRLLSVLRQLSHDVAWSIFMESRRQQYKGQVSDDYITKVGEMIDRGDPSFLHLS